MGNLRRWVSFVGMAAAIATASACGSETPSEFGGSSSGSNGATSSGGNTFGGASSGGAGDGGGGEGGATSCSGLVDMFVILDRSNSMGDDGNIGTTNSKWTRAVTALSGYFNSQGAKDHAAAFQFFPRQGHTDALCATGEGYHLPAVPSTTPPPYLTLPTSAFDSILNSESPGSGLGTPIEAAIRGVTRFTEANRRGGRVTIGVLITDGDPNGCNGSLSYLSGLLAAHHEATKIRTYVIGMDGATFSGLEQIAQGGAAPEHPDTVGTITNACGNGNGPCRHWNVGDGNPAAFTAVMAAIQASADGCKEGGGFINPIK
jgi:hypothetical protein